MRTRVASTLRMLVRIFRISKLPADTSAMAPKLPPVPAICRSAVRARARRGAPNRARRALMCTRTRILREYRAAEERVEAARANRIGLFRVIAGRKPGAHLTPISSTYGGTSTHGLGSKICAFTTLRHSSASRALALGESLPMISRLLGHSQIESTARHAHLARNSVHDAAARIAASMPTGLLITCA